MHKWAQGKDRKPKVWSVAEIRRKARSELWGLLEITAREVANLIQSFTLHTDSEQVYQLKEGRRKGAVYGLTIFKTLLPSDLREPTSKDIEQKIQRRTTSGFSSMCNLGLRSVTTCDRGLTISPNYVLRTPKMMAKGMCNCHLPSFLNINSTTVKKSALELCMSQQPAFQGKHHHSRTTLH